MAFIESEKLNSPFMCDRTLCNRNAYPNNPSEPLFGHKLIKLLLKYGADPTIKDNKGNTLSSMLLVLGNKFPNFEPFQKHIKKIRKTLTMYKIINIPAITIDESTQDYVIY